MKKHKIADGVWQIDPDQKPGMRVPAKIFASNRLIDSMDEGVTEQITNVACLPGIVKQAMVMPDGHWGYGFPIGGVAAFSLSDGIISPGGIGFDINCGIRMLRTNLTLDEIRPKMSELVNALFTAIPTGVGCKGFVKLSSKKFLEVMRGGVRWCIENGFATDSDYDSVEENGHLRWADPSKVSDKAIKRGINQLGTLGSGNHFLEIEVIKEDNIYDHDTAAKLGIDRPNQIVLSIHCGSRGFGHQVATDYLKVFATAIRKYGIEVRDRELSCAPFESHEGQDYFAAMACAANNAFANRQIITHRIREVFQRVFGKSKRELGISTIYDVAHNIAKKERYVIDGSSVELLVHRKGATRSFGPNSRDLPARYMSIGQPVIVGGSMQSGSYLLVGTNKAEDETFGSTLHGAGRTMSRMKAKKQVRGNELQKQMQDDGIIVRAASMPGLAEEAGIAYKNIDDVVEAVDSLGISKKVAKMIPLGNIKG
jgi:tRNA-splicing ligase RtcB (3'-phosphate/5'-hydroxy nucleic acid ligase)